MNEGKRKNALVNSNRQEYHITKRGEGSYYFKAWTNRCRTAVLRLAKPR